MPAYLKTQLNNDKVLINVVAEQQAAIVDKKINKMIYRIALKDDNGIVYGALNYLVYDDHIEILQFQIILATVQHIDRALLECALAQSYALEKMGNIELAAASGDTFYWYQLGFQLCFPEDSEAIDRLVLDAAAEEPLTPNEGLDAPTSVFMYYPDDKKLKLAKELGLVVEAPRRSSVFKGPFSSNTPGVAEQQPCRIL